MRRTDVLSSGTLTSISLPATVPVLLRSSLS
jgi:hypothetical protein